MFRNPTTDLIIVLVIVLLIFGPKRLPTLGRTLGQGLREFKDSITGDSKSDDAENRPELTAPSASPDITASAATAERQSAEIGSSERRP
jgi:sec-independent protein translocase protein TatA